MHMIDGRHDMRMARQEEIEVLHNRTVVIVNQHLFCNYAATVCIATKASTAQGNMCHWFPCLEQLSLNKRRILY